MAKNAALKKQMQISERQNLLKLVFLANLGFCSIVILAIAAGLLIVQKQKMAISFPVIAGLVPLPFFVHALIKRQKGKVIAYFVSLLTSLLLGGWGAWIVIIGAAASARSGMRW